MSFPSVPGEIDRTQVFTNTQVYFDPEAFDDAIRAHGASFIHWRAMRCPVGIVDLDDSRRPDDDHSGCTNGFMYTIAGKVTCAFTGNNNQPQMQETGILDGSSVNVTLPRFYDDTGLPVYIVPFDRLYLAEESIVVVEWELTEAHATGRDKLRRPAVKVQDLVDNKGIRYTEGVDFEVQQGQVVWLTQNRPQPDLQTGKGAIYAVRYLFRPYWYVKRLEHEVRVSQVDDPEGNRHTVRMPQAVSLMREFVFEKEEKDAEAAHPESYRQVKGPREGSFGPR